MEKIATPEATHSRTLSIGWIVSLAGVFLVAAGLYIPVLKGTQIWDDVGLMSTNSKWGSSSLFDAFTRPFGNYYRPLTSASFAIENGLYHGNPLYYHLTNLALHALTSVVICLLAYSLTQKRIAGVLSGIFFATQPMQVGPTAWIGGRTDVLSALLLSVFLWTLVRYHQTPLRRWLVLSVAAYFLAALTKEQAAAMVFAVPLSTFVFGSKQWKDARRLCTPYGAVLVLYVGLWLIGGPKPHGAASTLSDTVTLALRTGAFYGTAFMVPNERSIITFTLERYRDFFWIPLGAAFAVGLALFIKDTWKRYPPLCWLAVCGLLVYVPISNFPTIPALVVGPYRCGESGVAVACLFGIGFAFALSYSRLVPTIALAANLIGGTAVTWWGVHQWLSEEILFTKVYDTDPHFMLGVEFYSHYQDAKGNSLAADSATFGCLAWVFNSADWPDLVAEQGKAAITPSVMQRLRTNQGRPDMAYLGQFMLSDAIFLSKLKNWTLAATVARDGLIFAKERPDNHYVYAGILIHIDRQAAIAQWEICHKLDPGNSDCQFALGHQRIIDHRYSEAAILLESALKSRSQSGYGWLDLVDARLGLGDVHGAKEALEKADHAQLAVRPIDLERRRVEIQEAETGVKEKS